MANVTIRISVESDDNGTLQQAVMAFLSGAKDGFPTAIEDTAEVRFDTVDADDVRGRWEEAAISFDVTE